MKLLTCLFIACIPFKCFSQSGIISTFAGNGTGANSCAVGDGGFATSAMIWLPQSIAIDAAGNLFVADYGNGRIRKIFTSGVIHTIAGGCAGYCCGPQNGVPDTTAWVGEVPGLAFDNLGNLFIADYWEIQKIDIASTIYIVAGNGIAGYSGDGVAATSTKINLAEGVAIDPSGNFYIADTKNHRIRKVNTSGIISTIAGNGTAGYSGDGGPATGANLNSPTSLIFDVSGNLLFTDKSNNRVRKINTSGIISTVVGNGTPGFSGDGGSALSAQLNLPHGIATDAYGNIYISDWQNSRIRVVNTIGVISTFAGNGIAGFSGDGGPAISAKLNGPTGIAVDPYGNLFICDENNNRVRKVNSVSTGITSLKKDFNYTVSPNPTSGSFNIDLKENSQLNITNILGQEILNENFDSGKQTIDIRNQASGIYFVKVVSDGKQEILKLIKE